MARRANGTFAEGTSGNPAGRPQTHPELTEAARAFTVEALDVILAVMRDKKQSGATRLRAAEMMLARGWGEPTKPIALGVDEGDGKLELHFIPVREEPAKA
jgi:hypothetical protein